MQRKTEIIIFPESRSISGLGHPVRSAALLTLLALVFCFCSSCGLIIAPTPTNEEIKEAIAISNAAEAEPLDLFFEGMLVPHRLPGKAHAVLFVPEKDIQRNFTVVYNRRSKSFFVESYITLE